MPVNHAKVSAKSDGGDSSLVRPSDWNADHSVTGLYGVLLGVRDASSSASLDFTSVISATYDEYLFEIFKVKPATTAVTLVMECSTDNGSTWDTSASNYAYLAFRWIYNAAASEGANPRANIPLTSLNGSDLVNNDAGYDGVSGTFRLYDPAGSNHKRVVGQAVYYNNAPNMEGISSSGEYLPSTAVNAVRFKFSSGNIASGSIRVYGIAKT